MTIQQQDVMSGGVPLRRILESGAHFFSYPYFPQDGWGEGADGPRAWQRKALYPNSPFSPYATADGGVPPPIPFLRLNGIDSQSCYECHTSIGATVQPDLAAATPPGPATRTQPAIGGAAGIGNNAFINSQFPNPLTQLIRNPPHVFGTGYTQALANEITGLLLGQQAHLADLARYTPDKAVTLPLSAKNLSFGWLGARYDSKSQAVVYDYGRLTGVAQDLVVRPFQWKGIASSVRHFAAAATQFHFSMEAVEVVGENNDNDGDGVINELSYGNIGALTSFVALTRPPVVETPADQTGKARLARGAAIFAGTATDAGLPAGSAMCASCHVPVQTLDRPVVTIEWGTVLDHPDRVGSDAGIALPSRDAGRGAEARRRTVAAPTLVNPLPGTDHLPVVRETRARLAKAAAGAGEAIRQGAPDTAVAALYARAVADADTVAVGGLEINLNTLASRASPSMPWRGLDGGKPDDTTTPPPAYARARLPHDTPDGPLAVPLLSDLRLHDMGPCLADIAPQGTDVAAIAVPPQQFLTRPLWGVADSWPYLHDGRALDLVQAIRFHGGTRPDGLAAEFPYQCAGSEADPVINAFYALGHDDQQALIAYLSSLRLPPLPGAVVPF
ncbi:di-heme oxidoredictase family protein [Azospirillum agricola]|uniref:di-heme oxidoredictase family protein n=1 Tax=Azospirillum agricola TaxID=1720247 RepID=UPI0015C47AE9|nr:di-heme oxidoredictase family protein [Azospirillum agricola]